MDLTHVDSFLNQMVLFKKLPKKYQKIVVYINKLDGVYNFMLIEGYIGGDNNSNDIWCDTWSECIWYLQRVTKEAQ